MGELKKFFKSLASDINFSMLGESHSTNEAPKSSSSRHSKSANAKQGQLLGTKAITNAEMKEAIDQSRLFTPQVVTVEGPQTQQKILFCCPSMFGNEFIASSNEIDKAIDDYLSKKSRTHPSESAALKLVRGLEKSQPPPFFQAGDPNAPTLSEIKKRRKQNLIKVVRNLIQNPTNPTYRRLRVENQLINDLLSIEGADSFFAACGFKRELLPSINKLTSLTTPDSPSLSESQSPIDSNLQDVSNSEKNPIEEFLVITEELASQKSLLEHMLNLLEEAQPILPELYRDTKVFVVTGAHAINLRKEHLPEEYFTLSREECKRALSEIHQANEISGMLLTKALREKLRIREIRLYRYALIRVRFPSCYTLQGTFYASDRLSTVYAWISECLESPSLEFKLWSPPGHLLPGGVSQRPPTARTELSDFNSTLSELGLAPCSVVSFEAIKQNSQNNPYLKKELTSQAKVFE